jgi:hypothetical protein
MTLPKTKAISQIEGKMEDLDETSLRYRVLQSARNFKTSWIELGNYLQAVFQEKHYKRWGYTSFESYCSREIAIKTTTALKLLRSYYFLESEEPAFLKERLSSTEKVVALPSVDSVDILRRARNRQNLDADDYRSLRDSVLEKGEEPKEVRYKLKNILEAYAGGESEEEEKKRRTATINRCLGVLRTIKREIEISGVLPRRIVKEIDRLVAVIETEASGRGTRRQGAEE